MCVCLTVLQNHTEQYTATYTEKSQHCPKNKTNNKGLVFLKKSPNKNKQCTHTVEYEGMNKGLNSIKFMTCIDMTQKKTCLQHLDDSKSLTAWNIYQQGIESLIYL